MKDFTKLPKRQPIQTPPQPVVGNQIFIARSLASSVNRSPQIVQAIVDWLMSFQGAMSKQVFNKQMCKLSNDDDKALRQLQDSHGKRVLAQVPREKPPKLTIPIMQALAEYTMVAIEGNLGKRAITKFLDTLSPVGVYILNVNELILEYTDYQHRGRAGDIIEQANRADVLVIEGLEKPIALAYHIKDTLFQLAEVRSRANKYTLSTYNYTHDWYIPEYKKMFKHFSV